MSRARTLSDLLDSNGDVKSDNLDNVTVSAAAVSDQANTSTGYIDLPSGTEAQRPSSPSDGFIRYNSDDNRFEGYEDGEWKYFTTAGIYSTESLFYDFDPADLTYSDNTTISSGTAITDRSGNLTTTVRGTNLVFRTAAGGHLDTNSANGYLNTTDTGSFSTLSSATSISIILWFQSNGASRQVLVARYGTGWPNQFNHIVDPTGDFHFNATGAIGGASGDLNSGSNWWENDTWHHSAWVYDVSDGIMRWYIDGAQVVTFDAGTDSGNGLSVSSTANFSIGSRSDDLERLNGKIGPVRLYTRAVPAAEILTDYTNTRSRFGV